MEAGREDRGLGRTIALLVSLAGLAERTAGRCLAVRFVVLLLLRRAEELARDYAAQVTGRDGLWFDDGLGSGCGPAEARLIAMRFHDLAAFLAGEIEPADPAGAAPSRGLAAALELFCAPAALAGPCRPHPFSADPGTRAAAAALRLADAAGPRHAAPAARAVLLHDTS